MKNNPDNDNQGDNGTSQAAGGTPHEKSTASSKAENAASQAGKLLGGTSRGQDVTDAANQARTDAERSASEASSKEGSDVQEGEASRAQDIIDAAHQVRADAERQANSS